MVNPTLLLIDDNEQQIKLFSILLKSSGYDIVTAVGGQAGLEVLSSQKISLVICDMMMPGMDGPSFVTEMRSRYLDSSIPIILLSAMGEDLINDGQNFGADAVCSKSKIKDTLLPLLASYFPKPSS